MKKKLILTALIAAVAMPVMTATPAAAQSRGELRRDREQIREEQRELRRAQRYGTGRDVREERRDVREARREYREDRRDRNRRWGNDDWRGWRDRNRGVYARGNWRAPFRYYGFRPGVRIAPRYYGSRYYINDPWRYRLPPVGRWQRWVRHYDDMLLVDTRRGVVVRVIRNFFW
jgi:Ni/Co efflux regulator RcnB